MTNQSSIFMQTLYGEKTKRPPVWFMRQAGRVLPRYNALKQSYSFRQLMENPQLATDVTLMPIDDLGVDAAILFSDILVIPQAMGMDLQFPDSGPIFTNPLIEWEHPEQLLHADSSKLQYIYDVIHHVVASKSDDIPLIGFCGSSFTVLLYMLQGIHRKSDFPDAIKYMYQNPETVSLLLEKITDFSIEYMLTQKKYGVDAFQLFDTHAGLIPFDFYAKTILPHVERMASAAKLCSLPFIFFPKGIGAGLAHISPKHCDFVSIDWQTSLFDARALVHPKIGLQGNLDPRALYATPNQLLPILEQYKAFGKNQYNWIFNLGHGFLPDIPYEHVKFVVDWINSVDWQR